MKNKKGISAILSLLVVLCLTGCGFQVGNVPSNESYADLFPDRAEAHKNKNKSKGYNFSLEEYGNMMIHVDESEGHEFVLQGDRPGFDIVDADGNVVMYGGIMTPEAFKTYTDEIRKSDDYDARIVNGNVFECCPYGDGDDIDAYIYLADFGIDAGLVLETKGGADAVSLIALRGEPVESSLDQVETMDLDTMPEDDTDDVDTTDDTSDTNLMDSGDNAGSTGAIETNNVNLSDDALKALSSLTSDYNKINWGVRYAPSEAYGGFVISVTPYVSNNEWCLLVGFTNVTSEDLSITASGKVKGTDEDIFVYEPVLGKGNTVVTYVNCGDQVVDGSISWDEIQIGVASEDEYNTEKYVAWEADWTAKDVTGGIDVEYSIYAANQGEEAEAGEIMFVLLDKDGFVIDVSMDYPSGTFSTTEKVQGSTSFYLGESSLVPAGVAMFANPKADKN